MPTKVLVFESDPAFAGELRAELSLLGLVAQVVDDGNAGLMAAASERPDLILLSIELPRMNGFSVCNKLKKDPALKDVPLIIMSSESSDETFEQHRKLRTRAEDYVHKPIAFGELLEHMRPYVALDNGNNGPIQTEDASIVIDDEIEVDDLDELGEENGGLLNSEGVDAEVEAFANDAFEHLLDEGGPHPAAPAAAPSAPIAFAEGSPFVTDSPSIVEEVSPMSTEPSPLSMEEVSPMSSELSPMSVELSPVSMELSPVSMELSPVSMGEVSPASLEEISADALEIEPSQGSAAAPAEPLLSLSEPPPAAAEEPLHFVDADPARSEVSSEILETSAGVDDESSGLSEALASFEQGSPGLADLAASFTEASASIGEVLPDDVAMRSSMMPPSLGRKSTAPPRPTVDAEVERLRGELERQKTESARLEREVSTARAEVQRLEEAALQDIGSNDQIVRMQRELEELRQRGPAGVKVGGVSSREFLDLREALNKKDKEILSLRDQITRKEKELLDASDSALTVERERADLDDKIGALEKEVQAARIAVETAKADKEQAAKRAEDFKARGEKVKAELEVRMAELSTIHRKHEDELTEREGALAALREETKQELLREAEAKESALAAAQQAADARIEGAVNDAREDERRARYDAVAKLKEEWESERRASEEALGRAREEAEASKALAVAARESELQRDSEQRIAELLRAHGEEVERLRGDLARVTEDAAEAKARSAEREREQDLTRVRDLEAQKSEIEGRLQAQLASQSAELESRANELAADLAIRTDEREIFSREVIAQKEKLGHVEAQLAEVKAEAAGMREKLAAQTQKLDAATSKWQLNRTSLEQAKDAIAAAVAQIEEAETRGLE